MPRIEVEDAGSFDVEEGKRLVLAIEEDAGVDILHRCGSYARCTTCRIEYLEGEPEKMTKAVGRNTRMGADPAWSCAIPMPTTPKVKRGRRAMNQGRQDG